ncbi:hypothetical protein J14TS2_42690 [Bacillus sp. J14TS2]|uniref:GNAT family N-acetyltransferase n=1 Tax=Bacillus sp. J14TS2 TaxID=2807188 RepID=UPI001B0CE415|nr:N-acetyltransferase [Bacillus sp. J14TS2]GIN73794.1 hypothetical protein J14TS2_42690 [Bacillus sp. J14TS2]
MTTNTNVKILHLLSLISTDAKEYVKEAFKNSKVSVVYHEESSKNQGTFCLVENIDQVIAYAVFNYDNTDQALLDLMAKKLRKYFTPNETKEICFNVYGKNTAIIKFVKELGFVTDMEGFQLKYSGNQTADRLFPSPFIEKGFTKEMLGKFTHLFDRAYFHLNKENGWSTATDPDEFLEFLDYYESLGQVRSFWLDEDLIGAYIISGEYIRDFVVDPDFQNQGCGTIILEQCIERLRAMKGIENILLRVAKSNTGAKRFYEKNNFIEIANFSEHTYAQKQVNRL